MQSAGPCQLLTQAVYIQHIVLDAVETLALSGAVGVEVPVLGFAQVFVIDCLLPCFHSAVFAEIEVGRGAVAMFTDCFPVCISPFVLKAYFLESMEKSSRPD